MIPEGIALLVQEGSFQHTDLTEIFSIGTGAFALVLLGISLVAYKKVKQSRLLLVSGAFFIFAVKTFAEHIDILFPNVEVGSALSLLLVFFDFMVLLLLFLALVKK
jgi:hypothetical protein